MFAETRGAAEDGAEAVQVEYEALPVVADPFTAKKDEVILRPDRESKTNHIYHWEVGDKEGAARALDASAKRVKPADLVPALPPGAARAVRVRRALRRDGPPAVPRHIAGAHTSTGRRSRSSPASRKTRSTSSRPTSAGASETRCRSIRDTCAPSSGALKMGRPVKWIESRTENLTSTGFARDYHMDVELGADAGRPAHRAARLDDRRPRRLRRRSGPDEVPGGDVRRRDRQLRLPGGARRGGCATSPTRPPAGSRIAAPSG